MNLLNKVLGAFRKYGGTADHHDKGVSERGLLIFEHTSEVIRAESLLKEAGIDVCGQRTSTRGPNRMRLGH